MTRPTPAFNLRPAAWRDFAAIHAMRVDGLRQYARAFWHWDEVDQYARFQARFDPANYRMVIIDGQVAGAVSVLWRADGAFLADLEISSRWRGRSLGTAIVRGVLAEATPRRLPVTLQVLRNNPAQRLYARLGFLITAETATHLLMRWDDANGG